MESNLLMNEESLKTMLKGMAVVLAMLPTLIGVAYGLVHGATGICKAADYSVDLIHAIMPMGFISAPSIFSIIMFFYITVTKVTSINHGIRMLVSCTIQGVGNCFGAYCIGKMACSASVTKAQQKKFNGSFFLIMVFGEIVALFSLVGGMIFLSLGA
ncbi:V-type proton ATPase subunit c (VMA3) [Vairimorpha necatrix]|uniref:V-type proton ATPase subunit c (VMA3) n=1 Tax=Vairimorpha necatrix TaxID=6039 RepID=A0AAX4JBI0_9MICR